MSQQEKDTNSSPEKKQNDEQRQTLTKKSGLTSDELNELKQVKPHETIQKDEKDANMQRLLEIPHIFAEIMKHLEKESENLLIVKTRIETSEISTYVKNLLLVRLQVEHEQLTHHLTNLHKELDYLKVRCRRSSEGIGLGSASAIADVILFGGSWADPGLDQFS